MILLALINELIYYEIKRNNVIYEYALFEIHDKKNTIIQ